MAEGNMPAMEYQRSRRSKHLIVYHLILVVKYRKPLLGRFGDHAKCFLEDIAKRSEFQIPEMEVDKDHIHLLVVSPAKLAPAQIVRRLKAESTRLLWEAHPELCREFWKRNIFWSDGYFCASIGNASLETVRQYIENQG
jgi:putative transposase